MSGVKPVVVLARKYPADGSSSHVIGYVSDTSVKDLENSKLLRKINVPGLKTGKNGLEKFLNERQSLVNQEFKDLKLMLMVKRIKELKLIKGSGGENFRTTIDQEIQKFASKLAKG